MKLNFNTIELFFFESFIIFLLSCLFLCILLVLLYSLLDICYTTKEVTSASPYECGFLPYGEANTAIDLNFGAIAILFIIFDLETIMLLPIITDHALLDIKGYSCIIIFLFTFIIGLYYEIKSQVITL